VGAIFGVGFLREALKYRYNQRLELVSEYMIEKKVKPLKKLLH
jgi:polyferredoxin